MSLRENFKLSDTNKSDTKKEVDIFDNQEFTKTAPDIVALHDAIFPKFQADYRKHIEDILGKPFITVKAANERIKQSKAYEDLVANNVNYKKWTTLEILKATKREYRSLDEVA